MISKKPAAKGFTLVELMIVVSIIGIMSAIAMPAYSKFQCRTKQSEAKEMLKAVWLTEEAYGGESGRYLALTDLTSYAGLDPITLSSAKYYEVAIVMTNNGDDFVATVKDTRAGILPLGANDQWELTSSDARPFNVLDRCFQ